MKKTGLLIALLVIASCTFAQRANQKWYKSGLGARFEFAEGYHENWGVTYDRFTSNTTSMELLALTDLSTGFEVGGFFKYIKSLPDIPASLRWYAGIGIHGGKWTDDGYIAGADALLGIGYTFSELPINLTVDWHPRYNVLTNDPVTFYPAKFGFNIRYIIE